MPIDRGDLGQILGGGVPERRLGARAGRRRAAGAPSPAWSAGRSPHVPRCPLARKALALEEADIPRQGQPNLSDTRSMPRRARARSPLGRAVRRAHGPAIPAARRGGPDRSRRRASPAARSRRSPGPSGRPGRDVFRQMARDALPPSSASAPEGGASAPRLALEGGADHRCDLCRLLRLRAAGLEAADLETAGHAAGRQRQASCARCTSRPATSVATTCGRAGSALSTSTRSARPALGQQPAIRQAGRAAGSPRSAATPARATGSLAGGDRRPLAPARGSSSPRPAPGSAPPPPAAPPPASRYASRRA